MWSLWQRGHCSGRSCHRSVWMEAWHWSALKSWCKCESIGMAEHLLVSGTLFLSGWEILTFSCRFYTLTNREKLSDIVNQESYEPLVKKLKLKLEQERATAPVKGKEGGTANFPT